MFSGYEQAYYLIRPNKLLLCKLIDVNVEWGCLFSQSEVWRRMEAAHVTRGFSQVTALQLAQVKLAFLSRIETRYVDEPGADGPAKFIQEILGVPPWTPATFDRWWECERFTLIEETYEEVVSRLSLDQLKKLFMPGDPLGEEWLAELRVQQEAESGPSGGNERSE